MRTIKSIVIILMSILSWPALAQGTEKAELFSKPLPLNGDIIVYLVGGVIFMLLIIALVLWQISTHLKKYYRGELDKEEEEYKYSWERFMQFKPVSSDKDSMLHHSYDGIVELDNPPPPWFMFLFYGTIVFAVFYIGRYWITSSGLRQDEEYVQEMKEAEIAHKAYLAKAADLIDESNVTVLNDVANVDAGKALYMEKCAVCHKPDGGGSVGPNLTDEYWLHGGSVKDIFKTIKYGVTEKGMQSWQKDLTALQMQQLSSYILTIQGTNPPEAKPAQGDKYVPEGSTAPAVKDTTAAGDVAIN